VVGKAKQASYLIQLVVVYCNLIVLYSNNADMILDIEHEFIYNVVINNVYHCMVVVE